MFKEANYYPLHALLVFNYKSKTSTPPKFQRSVFIVLLNPKLSTANVMERELECVIVK